MPLTSEKLGRENYLKRLPNRWHAEESWNSLKMSLPQLESWSRRKSFSVQKMSGLPHFSISANERWR